MIAKWSFEISNEVCYRRRLFNNRRRLFLSALNFFPSFRSFRSFYSIKNIKLWTESFYTLNPRTKGHDNRNPKQDNRNLKYQKKIDKTSINDIKVERFGSQLNIFSLNKSFRNFHLYYIFFIHHLFSFNHFQVNRFVIKFEEQGHELYRTF